MTNSLKLMTVFPHPDDESLGMGGVLARYAAEGVAITIVCLTKGERGWPGSKETNPGFQKLGEMREKELRCAGQALGIEDIVFLGYLDGDVDQADPHEISAKIAGEIRRVQPQVVVTFGPDGAYGHPDHIAASQFTHLAVLRAADPLDAGLQGLSPHAVRKLYYMIDSQPLVKIIKQVLGGIEYQVDGVTRYHFGWPDWMITTQIDAHAHVQTAWNAILCHQTQLPGMPGLTEMPEDLRQQVWGRGNFYRAFSSVNNGREKEIDLFTGLR